MEPTPVTITLELANQMLGYLGKRPYEEVFSLINEFQRQYKENASLANGVQFPEAQKVEVEEVDGRS
jgi:hypothetical protein